MNHLEHMYKRWADIIEFGDVAQMAADARSSQYRGEPLEDRLAAYLVSAMKGLKRTWGALLEAEGEPDAFKVATHQHRRAIKVLDTGVRAGLLDPDDWGASDLTVSAVKVAIASSLGDRLQAILIDEIERPESEPFRIRLRPLMWWAIHTQHRYQRAERAARSQLAKAQARNRAGTMDVLIRVLFYRRFCLRRDLAGRGSSRWWSMVRQSSDWHAWQSHTFAATSASVVRADPRQAENRFLALFLHEAPDYSLSAWSGSPAWPDISEDMLQTLLRIRARGAGEDPVDLAAKLVSQKIQSLEGFPIIPTSPRIRALVDKLLFYDIDLGTTGAAVIESVSRSASHLPPEPDSVLLRFLRGLKKNIDGDENFIPDSIPGAALADRLNMEIDRGASAHQLARHVYDNWFPDSHEMRARTQQAMDPLFSALHKAVLEEAVQASPSINSKADSTNEGEMLPRIPVL